jgi:hypothetical protein
MARATLHSPYCVVVSRPQCVTNTHARENLYPNSKTRPATTSSHRASRIMLASRGFLRSAVAALRTQAPLRFFGAGSNGGIPSNLEHAVGLERAEAEALAQGKDLFEPQLVGPFGTKEHPVIVESIHHERIVGCPGHCSDGDTSNNNEIRWFKVTSKAPFVCGDCGQVCLLSCFPNCLLSTMCHFPVMCNSSSSIDPFF